LVVILERYTTVTKIVVIKFLREVILTKHVQNVFPSSMLLRLMFQVRQRLQKLDYYFGFLRVMSEDCRQRMLCEVTRHAERFYPLSSAFEEATRYQELLGSFYGTDVVEVL